MSRHTPPCEPGTVRMAKRMPRMGIAMQNTKITLCSCREWIKFRADHCELEGLPVTGAGRHGSPNRINQINAQICSNDFDKVDNTKWAE